MDLTVDSSTDSEDLSEDKDDDILFPPAPMIPLLIKAVSVLQSLMIGQQVIRILILMKSLYLLGKCTFTYFYKHLSTAASAIRKSNTRGVGGKLIQPSAVLGSKPCYYCIERARQYFSLTVLKRLLFVLVRELVVWAASGDLKCSARESTELYFPNRAILETFLV